MAEQKSGEANRRAAPRPRQSVGLCLAATLEEALARPEASSIFCPALAKFPARGNVWLSVLATHDNNDTVLKRLSAAEKPFPAKLYAGVLAVDPLRDTAQWVRQLKATGAAGVINFPSTSFIDGEAGTTLAQLSLGLDREIEFLERCREAGLRTAGVAGSLDAAVRLIGAGVDFLVLHAGPPTRDRPQPERALASKIARLPKAARLPLFCLSAIAPHSSRKLARTVGDVATRVFPTRPVMQNPGRFLLGAAIGTGMAARAAERGGADLLLALNAGRFRSMGVPSAACMLALRDANRLVMEFGASEILPNARVPVFFGASALGDEDLFSLVDSVAQAGFQGLVNFPSCLFLDGRFRQHLEECGMGFVREVALLKAARRRGLSTLGYVRTLEEARLMAQAGVDLVNIEFGWNMGGSVGVVSALDLRAAAAQARRVIRAVRKISPRTRCLIEGGPIVTPEQMDQVCASAVADGYIGGSTIDRVPLERAIEVTTSAFKAIGRLRRQVDSLEQQLRRKVAAEALIGLSEGVRRARAHVAKAMQEPLPVLIVGEPGTGRSEVARAIHDSCAGPSQRIAVVECRADMQRDLGTRLLGNSRLPGLVHSASAITIVLGEVANLSKALQQQLLQACRQPNPPRRNAGSARVIGLTRFDPSQHADRFDAEALRWLSTIRIDLAPLRERLEDVPLIAERMVRAIDARTALNPSCYRALLNHHWPGNLTELRAILHKSAEAVRRRPISGRDITPLLAPAAPFERTSFESEREWIAEGLRRNRFRREETARYLRISRKTLYNKMLRYRLIGDPR